MIEQQEVWCCTPKVHLETWSLQWIWVFREISYLECTIIKLLVALVNYGSCSWVT